MSFGRKVLSFLTLIFAVSAFSTFTLAQQTPDTKAGDGQPKAEGQKRDFGKYGRGERRGSFRGKGFGGKHRGRSLVRGLRQLGLSEGQNAQIKNILEAHKTSQQPYQEEMRSLWMKFKDNTATQDDKARMQELRDQSRASSEQARETILSVLTPEQVQKMEQMKAEREQRMEKRQLRWVERKRQRKIESTTKSDN